MTDPFGDMPGHKRWQDDNERLRKRAERDQQVGATFGCLAVVVWLVFMGLLVWAAVEGVLWIGRH